MGTTSTAILKTDSIMASKRGYAKVACQQVLKDQDIILPHRPGKFILVFFHLSMKSRLLVDSVDILDPDGVLVKFSRNVTSCRWKNMSTYSALGLQAKHFTARVGLPLSERSCIFAVYYKARRVYIAAPLRLNTDFSSVILYHFELFGPRCDA
ncbi:hypothetical protein SCHPADRAFT_496377 [Schizopora paradoxa]|uniref:Uncharacterized protein n=1 Tax=Schizopora paradoxa TaxID=27342 RepID=A0A0H2RH41_9AGAM|nr:hypothetical protein SCHPADRAFT_496377 [Schizopora paradoxa]